MRLQQTYCFNMELGICYSIYVTRLTLLSKIVLEYDYTKNHNYITLAIDLVILANVHVVWGR